MHWDMSLPLPQKTEVRKYYIFRWYQNDGTVNGYSITDISETPGLGMKAEEEDFYSQFENKTVDKFTVVKQKPASDDQIEAITGSTITSKAMANGCNAAIYYFQNALGGAQ